MWLDRVLRRLQEHPGPILIEGGEAYGAPYLIEALSRTQRVAWMQLTPTEASDFIAVGNRLAVAINRALEANFLPHALPFNYSAELLKKRLPLIGPLTIVCSNAEYAPLFRDSLLKLSAAGAKIILISSSTASAFQAGLHLRQEELALTPDEADTLAGHHLSSSEKHTLWRSSGGAYLTFMSSVCRLRNLPLPRVPSPQGDLFVPGAEALVSPHDLLEVLRKLRRYIEALELAVISVPERVPELMGDAGPAFQDEGLMERLHLLLEGLDDAYKLDERVLEWRLVAGFNQENYLHLIPAIEAHLANNEAPELRARYAGTGSDNKTRLAQAQRAVDAKVSPLTLYQLGRMHPDNQISYELLRRSVTLAEAEGRPYAIARNARALADRLVYTGRFSEAVRWSDWALKTFDNGSAKDGNERLRLLDSFAHVRIIMGQTTGLRSVLLEAMDAAESANLLVAKDFRIALANLELVLGNLQEAEEVASKNFTVDTRFLLGELGLPLVRILLERGKVDEAFAKAQYAFTLTSEEDEFYTLPASLALGMVYAFIEPGLAQGYLTPVLEADDIEASFRMTAALYLLKIGAVQLMELKPEMQELLKSLTPTGFHLLSGPETAFTGVRNALTAQQVPLRIRVLGQKEVWLNDKRLQLSDRALETLVLLALYPEGSTSEMLHSYLYEDDGTPAALRAAVSRLRQLVPISGSPDPYRIMVPFMFDVHDCEKALAAGDVRAALEFYRGPLLENSDAPGIREARLILEEKLRQSALSSGDASILLPLAETMRDDVELWQATHAALPVNDARLPLVRAQLRRVIQELHPTYN